MELAHTRTRHKRGGDCDVGRRRRGVRHARESREETSSSDQQPVVIGGSILDLTAKIRSPEILVGELVCALLY